MLRIKFREWEFEVHIELTKKAFRNESSGDSDKCNCDYCKNFRQQREKIYPDEIKNLFENLGIDFKKEEKVDKIYKLENGLYNYSGYFHFAGEIISGETFDSEIYSGIELVPITENFSVTFGERKINNWVKVLFDANIPWILEN